MIHTSLKAGSPGSQSTPEGFKVWRPGKVTYRDALAFQEELVEQRHDRNYDLLLLLEHPAVITLGRNANREHLCSSPEYLQVSGIECIETRRGGDITLHNPGQLVGYPVVDLNHYQRDLHRYLRLLEKTLIATLADYNLDGKTIPGKTGVWIDNRKIASIGIAVRRWISYHGFALNISNDLSTFDTIVPCGLSGVTMTSMNQELSEDVNFNQVAETFINHFSHIMQRPLLGDYYGN